MVRIVEFATVGMHRYWLVALECGLVDSVRGYTEIWPVSWKPVSNVTDAGLEEAPVWLLELCVVTPATLWCLSEYLPMLTDPAGPAPALPCGAQLPPWLPLLLVVHSLPRPQSPSPSPVCVGPARLAGLHGERG